MAEISNGKPLELLLIEDENNLRELFKSFLDSKEAKVTAAADGLEGIAHYTKRLHEENPYDAVLTDLKMPRADGAAVIHIVKLLSLKTQVIVITGRESTSEYQKLEEKLGKLKPDGILHKPILLDDLKYAVDQISAVMQRRKTEPTYQPEPSFYLKTS